MKRAKANAKADRETKKKRIECCVCEVCCEVCVCAVCCAVRCVYVRCVC